MPQQGDVEQAIDLFVQAKTLTIFDKYSGECSVIHIPKKMYIV